MTIPDTIAPAKPLTSIKTSAKANDRIRSPKDEKDDPGEVKYSVNLTLSTINIQTIG